ncbi:MAG TPA: hypothetical protein VFT16_03715 [Candidatus Saccharimonadales bacterium]|nr:hypothetical protein [Candidatus Saccharimonadales bacterium]
MSSSVIETYEDDVQFIDEAGPHIDEEAAQVIGLLAVGSVNYDCAVQTSRGEINLASVSTGDEPYVPGEKKTPSDTSLPNRQTFLRLLGPLRRECATCDPELNHACEDRTVAGNINNIVQYLARNGLEVGAVSAHSRHFRFGEGVRDFSITTPRTTSNIVMTARQGEEPFDRCIRRGRKVTDESIAERSDEVMRAAPSLHCTIISSCPHADRVLAHSVDNNIPLVAYSPGHSELKDAALKSRTLRQLYERTSADLRTIVGLNREEYQQLFGHLCVDDIMKIYANDLAVTDGEVGADYLHRDPETGEILHVSLRNPGFDDADILDRQFLGVTPIKHQRYVGTSERPFYLSSVGAGDRFFATLIYDLTQLADQQGSRLSLDEIQKTLIHADAEAKQCLGHKGATCDLTGNCECDDLRQQWERQS